MKKHITAKASFLAASQLFVLVNFAIAQPLYDILGQYAEYFTASGSKQIDIFILLFFLSFLLPALLILFELIIKTINEKLYTGLHLFHIFLFAALGILTIMKNFSADSGLMTVLVSCLLGVLISSLLFKSSLLKAYFVYLIPVPLIFCSLFLFNLKISAIAFDRLKTEIDVKPGVTDTPVVLVVFDELPTLSLLDPNFEIDRIRYPNIAALADHSYWFRNASTVSDDTLSYFSIDPSTPSAVPQTGILEPAADENFDKMYLAICINNTIVSVTKAHTNNKKGGSFLFLSRQSCFKPIVFINFTQFRKSIRKYLCTLSFSGKPYSSTL